MTQAFNLSQLANKVNSSGQLDGATGLTGTLTSSGLSITGNSNLATSSGNVGVGTTNPSPKITVARTATTSVTNASYYLGLGGTENLLDSKRLIGMGYSSGSTDEYPTAMGYVETSNGGFTSGAIAFYTRSGTTNVAPTERWRISSDGGLSSRSSYSSGVFPLVIGITGGVPVDRGINVSNSAGSAIPFIAYTSTTTQAGYILTSGSTIAFVQGSDYRLKENVVGMDKSETLSKLMKVRPVNFDWKDGNTLHNYGFLAHELQETFPQAVHGEKDAVNENGSIKTQSVNLTALVPYLVASIQEQQTIINNLKARIETLELK
jgi:hypothetical protein